MLCGSTMLAALYSNEFSLMSGLLPHSSFSIRGLDLHVLFFLLLCTLFFNRTVKFLFGWKVVAKPSLGRDKQVTGVSSGAHEYGI